MRDKVAHTVAEAMAQELTMPVLVRWDDFAALIDGYAIAKELGIDLLYEWGPRVVVNHIEGQPYGLDLLHLRLALFYLFRWGHHTDLVGNENDGRADEILREIAAALGQTWPVEGE